MQIRIECADRFCIWFHVFVDNSTLGEQHVNAWRQLVVDDAVRKEKRKMGDARPPHCTLHWRGKWDGDDRDPFTRANQRAPPLPLLATSVSKSNRIISRWMRTPSTGTVTGAGAATMDKSRSESQPPPRRMNGHAVYSSIFNTHTHTHKK